MTDTTRQPELQGEVQGTFDADPSRNTAQTDDDIGVPIELDAVPPVEEEVVDYPAPVGKKKGRLLETPVASVAKEIDSLIKELSKYSWMDTKVAMAAWHLMLHTVFLTPVTRKPSKTLSDNDHLYYMTKLREIEKTTYDKLILKDKRIARWHTATYHKRLNDVEGLKGDIVDATKDFYIWISLDAEASGIKPEFDVAVEINKGTVKSLLLAVGYRLFRESEMTEAELATVNKSFETFNLIEYISNLKGYVGEAIDMDAIMEVVAEEGYDKDDEVSMFVFSKLLMAIAKMAENYDFNSNYFNTIFDDDATASDKCLRLVKAMLTGDVLFVDTDDEELHENQVWVKNVTHWVTQNPKQSQPETEASPDAE